MAATLSIVINTDLTQSRCQQEFVDDANRAREAAVGISNFIKSLGPVNQGTIQVQTGDAAPVAATASIAVTHANVTNNDTTTICNTVITAATSGNGTTSWTIGANATADAVALAACINANTTLSKILVASAASGTVTLTVRQKGVVGNGLALATSDATAFGLTAFSGGAGGGQDTGVVYSLGL